MNMIAGAFFRAAANSSLTRLAENDQRIVYCVVADLPPTPTNISSKLEPEAKRNGTSASPATALASIVFPVPGGPVSKTPLGSFPPSAENFSGFLRNSTISSSSYRQSAWITESRSAHILCLFDTVNIAELDDLALFRLKFGGSRSGLEQSSVLHDH